MRFNKDVKQAGVQIKKGVSVPLSLALFLLCSGIFSSSVIPAQIVNARLPRFEANMM